jgi:uncharacterized protein YigE (DUF2233 family)
MKLVVNPYSKLLQGLLVLFALSLITVSFRSAQNADDDKILSYTADPTKTKVELYWKNDAGNIIGNIADLKTYVESKNKTLVFAMNGGMYTKTQQPQGLYIEDKKTVTKLDTASGGGNFYLKPNGVFYLTSNNRAVVCQTKDFKNDGSINNATQSGPMLVINGKVHPGFTKGSSNLNIRNGVGILPNNKILFAMSKTEINFYDFAKFFIDKGCKNALYLDGFVSRMYLPEQNWRQMDGVFGVMIGVTRDMNP